MEKNPFLSIIPRKSEEMIALKEDVQDIRELTKDFEKGKIIFISGDYGSGKSMVIKELEKNLPEEAEKKEFVANIDLVHELRALPMAVSYTHLTLPTKRIV